MSATPIVAHQGEAPPALGDHDLLNRSADDHCCADDATVKLARNPSKRMTNMLSQGPRGDRTSRLDL
jgi:hypothetical protein